MSKLTDRISFLKGMAAGMKLNMDKDANKLMLEMLTVMGEMAEEMAAMTEAHNDLNEYVESIDDDLADLEETLFGEEDGEIDEEMAEGEDDEDGDDYPDKALVVVEKSAKAVVIHGVPPRNFYRGLCLLDSIICRYYPSCD